MMRIDSISLIVCLVPSALPITCCKTLCKTLCKPLRERHQHSRPTPPFVGGAKTKHFGHLARGPLCRHSPLLVHSDARCWEDPRRQLSCRLPADFVSPTASHSEAPPLTKQLDVAHSDGGGEGETLFLLAARLYSCAIDNSLGSSWRSFMSAARGGHESRASRPTWR